VGAALEVVRRLGQAGGQDLTVEEGGPIGRTAEREFGAALPDDVVDFAQGIFERGGALLSGPGGGRYVYDLRTRLELFLKISPVQVRNGLPSASPLRPEVLAGVDLLIVRENVGGVYQGVSQETVDWRGGCVVRHTFSYAQAEVRRFLDAAARLAATRRGQLTVVTKEGGLPELSALWRTCALEAAEALGVQCSFPDLDLLAYQLVHQPEAFDLIAAPNLGGDVLGDLAGVLVGSRTLSFAGNFSPRSTRRATALLTTSRAPIAPTRSARSSPWRCCCARALASSRKRGRWRRAFDRRGELDTGPATWRVRVMARLGPSRWRSA
jgi:3-isopropylmalate dehydrogenase